MKASISRRFLIGLGVTALACTIVAAVAEFMVLQRELERRQVAFLSQYVQERTDNVDRRFSNLITMQRGALAALRERLPTLSEAEADKILKAQTRPTADGAWRSPDRAFDGYIDAEGGRVYGLAAFVGRPKTMSGLEKRAFAAAISIVARFGQAAHSEYDNFYFFTPGVRLVIFGPDRPDKLMFYRKFAPADLDISHEEMASFLSPGVNPAHDTRCTSLQRLVQDKRESQRVASACITPVEVQGQVVGGFGTSIRLDEFLNTVVSDRTVGAETLVMRADGQVIAAPNAPLTVKRSERAVAAYEAAMGLPKLAQQLNTRPSAFGVVRSADGSDIIAYGRLKGPNWYLLIRYPAAAVTWSAAKSAVWVLLVGAIGALFQTAMLFRLAREAIVRPLETLAASCTGAGHEAAAALADRSDEIGILARSLQAERRRADELLSSLEARVRLRTADLERANAELEKANSEKSRFLANMSHELRTPLNGVVALSETLAREQMSARNRELAELIAASGRLLESVLSDILDFSKIEAGEMTLDLRPFDLSTLVSRVSELHRASAEAKNIRLTWEVSPGAAGVYRGDEVRITQVLSNLLSNAVKFTEAGLVSLAVEAEGESLVFAVRDTGIGFDDEIGSRLFNRFEQADPSIRRRFGGTGLGLAICRSLVELMAGRIDAASEPGAGSTFIVRLPLGRVDAPAPQVQDLNPASGIDLAGVKVLLAEDHPTNRRVIQLILESVGVDLTMVENGRLALERLEHGTFDVTLMDIQMPELDGLEATRRLRRLEAATGRARTPVIMLTANALDEHVRASREAGADRHIAKPVRARGLLEAIAELSGQRADARPVTASA